MEVGSFRGVAVMDSVLESTMTSSKRSSSSRRGPIASPRWRTSSDASGERPAREARLFTSAVSAEMEELGGKGIKRRIGAAPGGVTVTVYRSIGTWDKVRRVRERNGEGWSRVWSRAWIICMGEGIAAWRRPLSLRIMKFSREGTRKNRCEENGTHPW
jgi:hypothetical protein